MNVVIERKGMRNLKEFRREYQKSIGTRGNRREHLSILKNNCNERLIETREKRNPFSLQNILEASIFRGVGGALLLQVLI